MSKKGITLSDLCEEDIDEVGILLGADAWPAIYSDKHYAINNLLAVHTKLGWTVTGTVSNSDTVTQVKLLLLY